ncbi:MAG: hypothetical protein Q4B28_05105 [bacterium]|nr:hypothetical protein [bacterium]
MHKKQISKVIGDWNLMKATEAWKSYITTLKNYRKKLITELLNSDSKEDRLKKDLIKFVSFAIDEPEQMHAELQEQLKLIQQQEREYDFD